MEKALRQLGIDFAQHAGDGDAARIGDNRDRNGRRQQDPAHPYFFIEKIGVDQRQEGQRKQAANAAARLHHVQLLAGELEHVAVAQHGNPHPSQRGLGHRAGKQLERKCDLVVDDRRERNHEGQQEQRKGQHAHEPRSADHQQQPHQRFEERCALQKQLRTQHADVTLQGRPRHHAQAPPRGPVSNRKDLFAALPGNETGHQRNEEPVADVFIIAPLLDQMPQYREIGDDEERRKPG